MNDMEPAVEAILAGLNPDFSVRLKVAGITSLAVLARAEKDDLAAVIGDGSPAFKVHASYIIGQARGK